MRVFGRREKQREKKIRGRKSIWGPLKIYPSKLERKREEKNWAVLNLQNWHYIYPLFNAIKRKRSERENCFVVGAKERGETECHREEGKQSAKERKAHSTEEDKIALVSAFKRQVLFFFSMCFLCLHFILFGFCFQKASSYFFFHVFLFFPNFWVKNRIIC